MNNTYETDTIAAIATGPGEAGIGIVRVSGANSLEIIRELYIDRNGNKKSVFVSKMLYYGTIQGLEGNALDEALCTFMKGPNSYTGEDVVEIQCHGGSASVTEILKECMFLGARLAEAGEFTKRAFLRGRIDLAQAEAVMDIISAKTGRSLNAAVGQLSGKISKSVKKIMDIEVELIAYIEAGIDFPEHDIEELTEERIKEGLIDAKNILEKLREGFEEGRLIKDGIKTAIVGKPNVGKSSLLNALINDSKAIVTDVPGTTRDIIEETLVVDGVLIKLLDTAGLRHTEDVVESIGVERTKKAIEEADLVLMVLDGSSKPTGQDRDIIELLKDKKVIIVKNKIDLGNNQEMDRFIRSIENLGVILVSTKNEIGIETLEQAIRKLVEKGTASSSGNLPVTNARHRELIEKAYLNICKAVEALQIGVPLDLVSLDIRDSWECLATLTGESITGDIATEIFSRFCIGK